MVWREERRICVVKTIETGKRIYFDFCELPCWDIDLAIPINSINRRRRAAKICTPLNDRPLRVRRVWYGLGVNLNDNNDDDGVSSRRVGVEGMEKNADRNRIVYQGMRIN